MSGRGGWSGTWAGTEVELWFGTAVQIGSEALQLVGNYRTNQRSSITGKFSHLLASGHGSRLYRIIALSSRITSLNRVIDCQDLRLPRRNTYAGF